MERRTSIPISLSATCRCSYRKVTAPRDGYTISALEKGKAMEQILSTTSKPIKIPGPDHPITIKRNPNRVVFWVPGHVTADTRDSWPLREPPSPPVQYVPRKD